MFYTNGKIVVHENHDEIELIEALNMLEEYSRTYLGNTISLSIVRDSEERKYPHVVLPDTYTFDRINEALDGNASLKSLGDESIMLPHVKNIEVKHEYTMEEKNEIAEQIAQEVSELNATEEAKKQIASEYKAKIDKLKSSINEKATAVNHGYEYRHYDCKVIVNFDTNEKYYVNRDEVVKTSPLDKSDKQMQMFVDKVDDLENSQDNFEDDEPVSD